MNTARTLSTLLAGALTLAPELVAAQTKVVVWHAYRGKERAALEAVADSFNKSHKDVAIELLPIPYDAFADKITAAIPRGKGPDLFIFAQDRIGDWAASGLIESVDFWADDKLRASFVGQTIDALTYDNTLYGLPMAFKMVALYYNTKLVPKPPETTDELIAMAKKLTTGGQFGLVYENANFYYQAAWMQGFGGRVFDKAGNPTLDSKEVIASMEFAQDLSRKQGVMPQEVTSTLVTTLFNQGKAAMVINGPWFQGELDDKVSYGVALLPMISKVNQRATPFLTAEGVLMSAKTANKEKAFEVMKHLTSAEAGKIMAKVGKQTSARKEVYEDAEISKDATLGVFKRQLEASVPMPNTPAMRMVWSPATTAMNKVINGGGAPAEAMKEAQAEVVKLVKGAKR
ncbi:MAG: extracellular solute-binding protein [Deltaproteobacteria bacterium]|nr:extracellular solute-binding protein [Deltaproteobacteria bacterium]